jgi:hypothetical protein
MAFKILKNLGFLVGEVAEPGQIALFRKFFGFSGSRVSMLTGDHLKIVAAELGFVRLSSAGISLRHGTHHVAQRFNSTVLPRQSESFRLAVGVLEGEVGEPHRLGCHRQRREFAMRQRAILRARSTRAAAGGIAARAPLQPADPVNSGKSDQSPDQDRANGKRNPPRGGRSGRGRFRHIVCHPVSDTAMQCRLPRSEPARRFVGAGD